MRTLIDQDLNSTEDREPRDIKSGRYAEDVTKRLGTNETVLFIVKNKVVPYKVRHYGLRFQNTER